MSLRCCGVPEPTAGTCKGSPRSSPPPATFPPPAGRQARARRAGFQPDDDAGEDERGHQPITGSRPWNFVDAVRFVFERHRSGGAQSGGTRISHPTPSRDAEGETTMGGILLWLIGIPIPLIILLYFIF